MDRVARPKYLDSLSSPMCNKFMERKRNAKEKAENKLQMVGTNNNSE